MGFNDDNDIEILEINSNSDKSMVSTNSSSDVHGEEELDVKKELMVSDSLSSSDSRNVNSSPSSKRGSLILFLVLFVFILLAIFFLPYTDNLFQLFFSEKNDKQEVSDIDNGSLICTLEREEDIIRYHYTETYDFENREVLSLQHVVSIQGETDFLNNRNLECHQLREQTFSFSGISVDCNLSSGELVETQFFDFSAIKKQDISSAFVEAGGVYPNVSYRDSVSEVKRKLILSGYECRES